MSDMSSEYGNMLALSPGGPFVVPFARPASPIERSEAPPGPHRLQGPPARPSRPGSMARPAEALLGGGLWPPQLMHTSLGQPALTLARLRDQPGAQGLRTRLCLDVTHPLPPTTLGALCTLGASKSLCTKSSKGSLGQPPPGHAAVALSAKRGDRKGMLLSHLCSCIPSMGKSAPCRLPALLPHTLFPDCGAPSPARPGGSAPAHPSSFLEALGLLSAELPASDKLLFSKYLWDESTASSPS